MAHGTPDWGVTSGAVTVHQVNDLGELAVRLGSIDAFDRRGDVLFLEDFEDGVARWAYTGFGAGNDLRHSARSAHSGLFSALLIGGSTLAGTAAIVRREALPVLSRLGVEIRFDLGGTIDNLLLNLDLYDGTNLTRYQVRWTDAANALSYLDSTGADVTIATVDLSSADVLFHVLKLVVDGPNGDYVRVMLDERGFTLPGVSGRVIADATTPRLDIVVTLTSRAGQNDEVFVEDVILTQNEPN